MGVMVRLEAARSPTQPNPKPYSIPEPTHLAASSSRRVLRRSSGMPTAADSSAQPPATAAAIHAPWSKLRVLTALAPLVMMKKTAVKVTG